MTEIQESYRDVLNEGYILHWYQVKSVLGRGAFGVTYLAQDKNLDQLVAIKEYFPRDFSSRASGYTVQPTSGEKKELYQWGLVRFVREAQTLAKFKHHNIVRVMSVFELNNTAYMVMEYEQGEELSKVYKRQKIFSEQELLSIFVPIMHGLKLVHDAGFIHRDIKPSNIVIRQDGSPVLIDFGAARKTIGTPTRTVTSLVTYGYAPFEQYNESEEKQGAFTDIFALGACLYLAVVGKLPVDALARGSSLLSKGVDPYEPASVLKEGSYSPEFLRAIDHALMFHATDRPQDILTWSDMLSGKITVPEIEGVFEAPHTADEDQETVVLTSPQGVSQRRGERSHPVTLPLTKPPAATAESSDTSDVTSPAGYRNRKVMGLMLVAIVLIVTLTVWFGTKQGEKTESGQQRATQLQLTKNIALLRQSAAAAFKAGKLLYPKTGSIYLYQQILKITPSDQDAHNRIQEIIDLTTDGIKSDLAAGYNNKALMSYQLLQAAVPNDEKVMALGKELETDKTNYQTVSSLLAQAQADFKAGNLVRPGDQNALSRYRRVLTLSPENQEAKRGIDDILNYLVTVANKNLASGNAAQVQSSIDDIMLVDPNSDTVEKLQRRLQTLSKNNSQQQEIKQLLSQAQQAFNSGNLLNPVNRNALVLYQRVLRIDKSNIKAKQGIDKIENELQAEFDLHLKSSEYTSAESILREIENVMPNSQLARNLRTQWERSKRASKSDVEIISDMIGQFKQAFETQNTEALRNISEFQANRQAFLQQFFSNYKSFKIDISDIKFIGPERKGTAIISIIDLINIQGSSVEPGTWGHFPIVIHRNSKGQWKIFW